MFQYAAGRAFALRNGVELLLDTSWFDKIPDTCTPRIFQLNVFPICTRTMQKMELCYLQWRHFLRRAQRRIYRSIRKPQPQSIKIFQLNNEYYKNFFALHTPVYLSGYWQSEKYFSQYGTEIKKYFTFPLLPSAVAAKWSDTIRQSVNSVSLHVRRGDYITDISAKNIHYIDFNKYYIHSLDVLYKKYGQCTIFVFSDDPTWARANLSDRRHTFFFIELPDSAAAPWHDMHLMSLCRHHIIANSSFSWWGAWLGKQDGMTIAPSRWFAATKLYNPDIYCPTWKILDC